MFSTAVLRGAVASQFAFVTQGNLVAHSYQELANCIAECVALIHRRPSAPHSHSNPFLLLSTTHSYVSSTNIIDDIFTTIVAAASDESVATGALAGINTAYGTGLTEYPPSAVAAIKYQMDLVSVARTRFGH